MLTRADWEGRYQSGDMPWEKGEPSPGLVDFLASNPELRPGAVLVPGCGTGHDVCAWARAGARVTGMDLAPSAVRQTRERLAAAGLAGEVIEGDFLREAPAGRFDWVFEHTLYCAIDPAERDRYVAAVLRALRPDGNFLAVHYMIDDREGPPFGCTQEELMRRFSPHLTLVRGWVPRSYPNRAGLELMLWWRRAQADREARAGTP